MIIDSHAHLNFNAFLNDYQQVIERCLQESIWMINVGTKYETSKRAVEIAQEYEKGVWAAIGLHPIHLDTGLVKMKIDKEEIEFKSREENFDYNKYKELARSKKVVAIGEIGLDYYWKPKTKKKQELFKEKQKNALLSQLRLAKELGLPVIFHCRMAHKDLISILLENPDLRPSRAVAHSFVGDKQDLKKYLDFGFYIGFNGIIFKEIPGVDFKEIIKITPLDKILLETDSPYLAPPPFQNKRNTPLNTKYIAEEISRIKKINFNKITEITTQNARELFSI
ncbi:MAG TPA: TatD family deoxyribonuclease [bacterium]|nr:TatD family deoxyribonuclease [bacterium]